MSIITAGNTTILSNDRKICAYLFCFALTVHLVYLSQYAKSPFFWVPELDSLFHDQTAQLIASGHAPGGVFFRAPGYYYFLAGVYKVFGHNYWAARIAQACIGSASCVLTFLLGRLVFRPMVGLLAAISMCLYGPLVFNNGELHTPVLEVFLDLAGLLLIYRASKSQKSLDWLYAGLVIGLSAVVRPNILIILAPTIWLIFRSTGLTKNQRLSACFFLVSGAFLMPMISTARNYIETGDPVFIASQGGINLYLGNRPGADGFTPSTPERYRFDGAYQDSVALYGAKASNEAENRELSPSESQAYWIHRVVNWWKSDPSAAMTLTGKKLVLAFTHQEIRNNLAYDYVRAQWAPSLFFCVTGFWYAGSLGILGMGLSFKRGLFEQFLVAVVVAYFSSFIAFFVADRYRLPMVPILLIFAAYALVWAAEIVAAKRYCYLTPAFAALICLAVFVNVDWFQTATTKTWAADYWSAGVRYAKLQNYGAAEIQDFKALSLDPDNPEILSSLAETHYYQRDFFDAATIFGQSISKDPTNPSSYYNLALCCEQLGDLRGAAHYLADSVRIDPTYVAGRNELQSVTIALANQGQVSFDRSPGKSGQSPV